jgi:Ni/Fe-hydrogenase subunit HybB-like protein
MLWERGHSLFANLQVVSIIVRWAQAIFQADQYGHIVRIARTVDRRYTVDRLDEAPGWGKILTIFSVFFWRPGAPREGQGGDPSDSF